MKKLAPLFLFFAFIINAQAQEIQSLADCMVSDCDEFFKPTTLHEEFKRPFTMKVSRHLNVKIENVENEYDDYQYQYSNIGDNSELTDQAKQLINVIGSTARLEKAFDAKDKQLHFRAGSVIGHLSAASCESGLISIAVKGNLFQNKKFFCALSGATVAGILKEIYDSTDRENHTVDAKDAIATALGAFTQVTLYELKF